MPVFDEQNQVLRFALSLLWNSIDEQDNVIRLAGGSSSIYGPDFGIEIKDAFDSLLAQMWQRSQSKLISGSQLLRAWRQPLDLLVDMQQAVQVEADSEENKETKSKLVESLMRSSLIGSYLVARESAEAELRAFVLDIERRLF